VSTENQTTRAAVESLAADLYKASQQVEGPGKTPATYEQCRQRAREVAKRHDRNNRNR